VAEIFTLEPADLLFLFDGLGQHPGLRAFLEYVVVVVDVEDEIGPVLLGERDAFVVDQAGVLDGIDARTYGVFDGLRAVSVSGDFAAELVSFFRNGPHLFESELGCAGLIAFAENTAGSADFDEVCSIFHHFANFSASSPGAIGDAIRFVMKFRG